MQKEVLLSHKLRDHAYEYLNPFRLKKDKLSQRNYQNPIDSSSLSHTEQEHQESLIHQQNLPSTKFERRPQIFVTLSFRELCDSKLFGLHAFDNMAIIH